MAVRSSHKCSRAPKHIDCSWPLPQDKTISPGRANVNANRIASPLSGTRQKDSPSRPPLDLAPAAISSRIPSSDSVRGSSAVSTVRSASSTEVSAIMRRFSLSRKPAEPKTAMTRGPHPYPSPCGRGVEHFSRSFQRNFQCVWRVSKIDDGCEVLTHVNTLHTTRDSIQCCNSLRGNFGFYFQSINRGSQRCETVRNVV